MIVVIQCAASKRSNAGHFLNAEGQPVLFVADPSKAPFIDSHLYARPDDLCEDGTSWRDLLRKYNSHVNGNPFALLRAFDLYENDVYQKLVARFGTDNTYILSAGWGLIRSDFLTPVYDITFSQSADSFKRRKKTDAYRDFSMLPAESTDPIFFFGGKDYVPLFAELTKQISAPKTVFFNSATAPNIPRCSLRRFQTSTRTNWHYECANAFIAASNQS
jgi:hypothetical protein